VVRHRETADGSSVRHRASALGMPDGSPGRRAPADFRPRAAVYHLYVCLACPWDNRHRSSSAKLKAARRTPSRFVVPITWPRGLDLRIADRLDRDTASEERLSEG